MDDIYLKIRDFLKKRQYDSFTIHQICEMLEKDFGKQDVDIIRQIYFKNNDEYLSYYSLKDSKKDINNKKNSKSDIVIPIIFIFLYISYNITHPQIFDFIFNFFLIFISFIYVNYIDYLKDYKSLISKNIPMYTAVFVFTYYLITNPILQKFHYFSLDYHINPISDLYIIMISFVFFIFLKIPKTIPLFLFVLFFAILLKEYFFIFPVFIFILHFILKIKFVHNLTDKYKILLKKYLLKLILDVSKYERIKYKNIPFNKWLFIILLTTIGLNIFVTLSYANISVIKTKYYNYMKEDNGSYCSNIPIDMKIIKSSSKYGYVVIDAQDINPLLLLYYIASKDSFNLGNINNKYQFTINELNSSSKILLEKNNLFSINYRDLIEHYYDNKINIDKNYFSFILKNENIRNELDKYFIIYDYFLETNRYENLFFYKCE